MGDEEKELCKPAHMALVIIIDTATAIMGTRERACQLPLFVYMAEKMCALCYERAWYSKLGGYVLGILSVVTAHTAPLLHCPTAMSVTYYRPITTFTV